jgi:RNA polymerase sigma-70 factor, ECF subfamily
MAAQTLDRASAEEIVQEVFVAVWRKASTFDPGRGTFRAWVMRIAHLRILNELRRRSRRPRLADDPEGQHLAEHSDPHGEPSEQAWRNAQRAAVRQAIEALPAPQRQALSMAFFDDLTHEQVASNLDLPLGTAKTRIRAGMQKLRVLLAPLVMITLAVTGWLSLRLGVRQNELWRNQGALQMVTSSDVKPIRLAAASGVPEASHGRYLGRPGTGMAVLTFSHLSPAPSGRAYQAWALYEGRWISLGTSQVDKTGHALLIAEDPHLAVTPEALRVTLEAAGGSSAPTGAAVIEWPARAGGSAVQPEAPSGRPGP